MMKILVLGTGCAKCGSLEKMTKDAVTELNIDAVIEKEEDIIKIMTYGVMSTPALVINETVVLSGKLPSKNELNKIISDNQ